ncbi:MAG: Uncharacterised protein [SAR116 cluster bacterium]|nr:MAG: Uncharacterised protein [SAR116 cluster bacterium]
MVSAAFQPAINAMVKGAIDCRPRHQPQIWYAAQFRQGGGGPVCTGDIIHNIGLGIQPSPHAEILIRQNDPAAGARGSACGGDSSGSGTNHQYIAMQKAMIIDIGIRRAGEAAQTGCGTDQWFIELFPESLWPHECLVIKTGAQQRCSQIINGHQVPFQRAAMILAARDQPVKKFGHRGACIGFPGRTFAQCNKRIRLFRPG